MSGITHATIRAAGLGDVEHILAEYRQAVTELPLEESANLLWRPYDEFKTAVENGLFFVIENAVGSFMAGAGVFDLPDSAEKELGMCYVKKEWRGYGLQALLLQIRICAATLGQVPDKSGNDAATKSFAALITGVKPANEHSAANTEQLGFESLPTPPPALFNACASCRTPPAPDSERKCCCDFFYLSDDRRAEAIEKSLRMENWSRTRNGRELIVALKIRHLLDADFRNALHEIAQELRAMPLPTLPGSPFGDRRVCG